MGELLDIVLDRYMKDCKIEAFIDNDVKKQGIRIQDYTSFANGKTIKYNYIMHEDILSEYDKEEVAIVILSTQRYEEIAKNLTSKGISNTYIGLIMCANSREILQEDEYTIEKYISESMCVTVNRKKIVIRTDGFYNGHGRQIAEQLLQKRTDLDIVWIANTMIKVPIGIRVILECNIKKMIEEMETAGFWLFEAETPIWAQKRQKQCYIQLKHWASVTLKTFYISDFKLQNYQAGIDRWLKESAMIDYVFVGSTFDEMTCREGFAFEGEVVYVGSPRTDVMFRQEEYREKVYDFYKIDRQVHTLLYAPTFRYEDVENRRGYTDIKITSQINIGMLIDALEKRFGGKWKILLRRHPIIKTSSDGISSNMDVIDVTGYDDGEELVAACEVMITDYSSIMFEPAFVNKPVFLYAPDKKEYIDKERGLLIDYDELPFFIAENNEELRDNIYKYDRDEYIQKVKRFMERFDVKEDGHASERAADFILNLLNSKEETLRNIEGK